MFDWLEGVVEWLSSWLPAAEDNVVGAGPVDTSGTSVPSQGQGQVGGSLRNAAAPQGTPRSMSS